MNILEAKNLIKEKVASSDGIRKSIGDFMRGDEEGPDARWGLLGFPAIMSGTGLAQKGYLGIAKNYMGASGPEDAAAIKNLNSIATDNLIGVTNFNEEPNVILARQTLEDKIKNHPSFFERTKAKMQLKTIDARTAMPMYFPVDAHPAVGAVHIPKGYEAPGLLAHEIGHGMGNKNLLSLHGLSKKLTPFGAMGALLAQDENNSKMIAAAGTAAAAPILYSELDASARGAKMLKDMGHSFRGRAKAFIGVPTYAAFAASPFAAHYVKKYFGGFDEPTKDTGGKLKALKDYIVNVISGK